MYIKCTYLEPDLSSEMVASVGLLETVDERVFLPPGCVKELLLNPILEST